MPSGNFFDFFWGLAKMAMKKGAEAPCVLTYLDSWDRRRPLA